jgi:hypothetical protein
MKEFQEGPDWNYSSDEDVLDTDMVMWKVKALPLLSSMWMIFEDGLMQNSLLCVSFGGE